MLLAILCAVILFLLQGKCHTREVFVEEGKRLTLTCKFPAHDNSSIQWLTPKGYIAFFNNIRVLKDRRFGLIRYSRNVLRIKLWNVTLEDEGVYTCLLYTYPVQRTNVNVTILAAPSKPIVVVSPPRYHPEDNIVLTCLTSGSKPAPEITWLLDNAIEVFGETKYSYDGKRCNATSSLQIKRFAKRSSARCIARHHLLHRARATKSFMFQGLKNETEAESLRTSVFTSHYPENETEAESLWTSVFTSHYPEMTTSEIPEKNFTVKITSSDDATLEQLTTTWSTTFSDMSERGSASSLEPSRSNSESVSSKSATTQIVAFSIRSSGALLLGLVGLMIFVLFIILQLFLVKLKRAHDNWKKENDISDQTLESTKSRSNNNEDAGKQQRNAAATDHKVVNQYNEVAK
ncbi:cytotoxic and regulatory T-cell molecule isoform X2 [Bombina bombina]|uniref:cytotoxic and regulatory T-cell molecule isoform X2 n=1 Tax=Bombina bombina TaxID=8345 RepID=UPI00235A64F8|nr:cytotoxic and regulatory T-cell molecule isoform X2 [Bombina bombina]